MADDREDRPMLRPLTLPRHGGAGRPEEASWPGLADPYRAAAGASDGEIPRLVVVTGKGGFQPGGVAYHILQYVHLGAGQAGFTASGDQWFAYVFADRQPKRLVVEGTNLLPICDAIGLHRMPWIREADRGFRGGGDQPVITRIAVEDWAPEGE